MPRITPTVKQILIGLFAAYVVQLVLENWMGVRVFGWLALAPNAPLPWQFFTYVLVNPTDPMWLLLGLLFISWSLSQFEIVFGRKRTWQLCAVVALSASVSVAVLGLVVGSATPLLGSTSLWYGSIAVMSWLDRQRPISFFGLFAMTAIQFLYGILALAVLSFVFDKDATRFVACLGAIGGGIGFANWLRKPRPPKRPPERKKARASGFKVIQGGQPDDKMLH